MALKLYAMVEKRDRQKGNNFLLPSPPGRLRNTIGAKRLTWELDLAPCNEDQEEKTLLKCCKRYTHMLFTSFPGVFFLRVGGRKWVATLLMMGTFKLSLGRTSLRLRTEYKSFLLFFPRRRTHTFETCNVRREQQQEGRKREKQNVWKVVDDLYTRGQQNSIHVVYIGDTFFLFHLISMLPYVRWSIFFFTFHVGPRNIVFYFCIIVSATPSLLGEQFLSQTAQSESIFFDSLITFFKISRSTLPKYSKIKLGQAIYKTWNLKNTTHV